MRIPKRIRIRNKLYVVKDVHSFSSGVLGEIHYKKGQILLAKNARTYRLRQRERFEVFWHEIVHGILRDMRRHDLNNERFVNAFCQRLYGVLK